MVSSALPTVSAKVIVVVVFEELAFDEDIAAVVTPGLDASCCDKPVKIRDFYSTVQIYCTILSNSTLNISVQVGKNVWKAYINARAYQ